MSKYFFALGLAPAFALGACGGDTNTTTTVDNIVGTDAMTPVNAFETNGAAAAVLPSADQAFADAAGASDYYEVEAGKLAQDKATTQVLKAFGEMMVSAHTDSTAKLKAAAAKADPAITPNPALNVEQEANLATLRQASGADFDNAYKTQQVAAHEKALAAMKDYAANGEVASLKTFAAETVKVVQAHLAKAKAL